MRIRSAHICDTRSGEFRLLAKALPEVARPVRVPRWAVLIRILALSLAGLAGWRVSAQDGAPQTIVWTAPADGRWQDAANWTPPAIPGSNDWVYITNRGAFRVIVDADSACARLEVGGAGADAPTVELQTSAGTLWIGESFLLRSGAMWRHSSVAQGVGDMMIQGDLDWTEGEIGGPGVLLIDVGGKALLRGTSGLRLTQRAIDNAGTLKFEKLPGGFPTLALRDVPGLTNRSGARTILSAGRMSFDDANLVATRFWNRGVVQADDGADLGVSFQNDGTLSLQGTVTARGGVNAGTLDFRGCCGTALNVYDSPGTSDPFVFAEGTRFTGTLTNVGPRLNILQDATWSCSTPHPGWLSVGDTNLATLDRPATFRVEQGYKNTNTRTNLANGLPRASVSVVLGTIEVLPGALFESQFLYLLPAPDSAPEALDIGGRMVSQIAAQRDRTVVNSGEWLVERVHNWDGGTLTGSGDFIVDVDAIARFVGTTRPVRILAQQVFVFGSNSVSGSVFLSDLAVYTIDEEGVLNSLNSVWQGVTGTLVNQGAFVGAGDFDIPVINNGFVHPNPSSGLRCSNFSQIDGETILDGGVLGAGVKSKIEVRGGTILGTNLIAGNLRAAAAIIPGNPNGDLRIVGSLACEPTCVIYLVLGGNAPILQFPTLTVGQSAALGGVLQVVLADGFYPKPGMRFPFLKASSVLNRFGRISSEGFLFNATYSSTDVTLEAVAPLLIAQASGWNASEGFRLSFIGDPKGRYQIQGSTDLQLWTPLGLGTPQLGLIEYLDAEAVSAPRRFYRIIQLDP
ncbi:MAG: hypothetical protein HY299_08535 [Verrucomicrobia bacterium]|nr:hypothetical protein [Verrucomicrobiota bacterium]